METSNPYARPASDLTRPAAPGVDSTGAFDPSGRFTRLSWLAWTLVLGLMTMAVFFGLMGLGLVTLPEVAGETVALAPALVALAVQLAGFVVYLIFSIRRFHDIGASGWWSVLLVVPLANLVVILVLILKRGSEGANRFGPPRPTPGWEKALGIVSIVFMVLGLVVLVAALAVPALIGVPQAT